MLCKKILNVCVMYQYVLAITFYSFTGVYPSALINKRTVTDYLLRKSLQKKALAFFMNFSTIGILIICQESFMLFL